MAERKKLLRALAGEVLDTPPIWMMRQAGRYLPEYRATRAQAGDFLSLCYNSELAAEVTLQPIRRYGFDAAIMFADILLVPQALGADLWFVTGEGPRLSTITTQADFDALKPLDDINDTLSPIYETLRILSRELPSETTLIGFAGAPWTVATYMIAGRGTPDQGPAHALRGENTPLFESLLDRITEATIEYLSCQIDAGAEVVKIFDSWAGSLPDRRRGRSGQDFRQLGRVIEWSGFRQIRAGTLPPHHLCPQGAPPGRTRHRLPARRWRQIRRVRQGNRRRLRRVGQWP